MSVFVWANLRSRGGTGRDRAPFSTDFDPHLPCVFEDLRKFTHKPSGAKKTHLFCVDMLKHPLFLDQDATSSDTESHIKG